MPGIQHKHSRRDPAKRPSFDVSVNYGSAGFVPWITLATRETHVWHSRRAWLLWRGWIEWGGLNGIVLCCWGVGGNAINGLFCVAYSRVLVCRYVGGVLNDVD